MIRALLLTALVTISPTLAAETDWQEVAPDVRLRLVSSGEKTLDGTTLLGLQVEMPDHYKTYWRVPGETGIATQIDWSGSDGIDDAVILYPYPVREEVGGYLDYVYHGPTLLPVTAKVGDGPVKVRAKVTMGICSDICVPVMADFALDFTPGEKDMGNGLRIAQAVSQVPLTWEGKQSFGPLEHDKAGRVLVVPVLDERIDPMSVIAATEDGEPLFGVPQKSPEQSSVILPIRDDEADISLGEKSIHLTFMADDGPYDMLFIPHEGHWLQVLD